MEAEEGSLHCQHSVETSGNRGWMTPRTPKGAHQPSCVEWAKTMQTREGEKTLLAVPRIRLLICIYGLYSFLYTGFDQVFPLWTISSVTKGGLDWTTSEIGQVLLACGLSILIFECFAVPCITKRIGVAVSNRVATSTLIPVLLVFPVLSRLNGAGGYEYATVFIDLFAFYACSNATYISLLLGINNATEEDRRGELNGIATTIGNLARVLGPAVCSAVFAASINVDYHFPLDAHLTFMLMASGMLIVALGGWNSIAIDGVDRPQMSRGSPLQSKNKLLYGSLANDGCQLARD